MTGDQVTKTLRIRNRNGLHGRAAARLVETAQRFQADIRLIREGMVVDGKSILDVLTTACIQGSEVTVQARGEDAEAALAALVALFESGFGEEQ